MKDDIEKMKIFKVVDDFFKNNEITKNLSREERILKLSKPVTIIFMKIAGEK